MTEENKETVEPMKAVEPTKEETPVTPETPVKNDPPINRESFAEFFKGLTEEMVNAVREGLQPAKAPDTPVEQPDTKSTKDVTKPHEGDQDLHPWHRPLWGRKK